MKKTSNHPFVARPNPINPIATKLKECPNRPKIGPGGVKKLRFVLKRCREGNNM